MMYERIVVPAVLYGAETWGLNVWEERLLNIMKIKRLRKTCSVTIWDRIRNEDIRRSARVLSNLSDREKFLMR